MQIQKAVREETLHIAAGTCVFTAVMFLIYAVLGKFTVMVAASGVLGAAAAVFNFFLLGLTVQKATKEGNEARSRSIMQLSYSVRMLCLMGVVFVGFAVPSLSWTAVAIPLLFPRITIFLMGFRKKSSGKEENS